MTNFKTERPTVNAAEERAVVRSRSGGRCEAVISDGCRDAQRRFGVPEWATEMHHRKMRSQGGPDTAANLASLCDACHAFIHKHPAVSYRLGLLIRGSDSDPVMPYTRAAV